MAADWQGNFGDDYTLRNKPDVELRSEFFSGLAPYGIESAFEVGCNVGTNLRAMKKALGCDVAGCDINNSALEVAEEEGLEVYYEDATDLDHESDEFGLVFTVGVLIHLNTPEMIRCMKEMRRISKGYIMFMEYKGNDIEVPYHGERGALIKRDYGAIYQALFPEAQLMETGFLPQEVGFDDVTYWVFYDSGDSPSAYGIEPFTWESDENSDGQILAATLTGTVGAKRVVGLSVSGYGART